MPSRETGRSPDGFPGPRRPTEDRRVTRRFEGALRSQAEQYRGWVGSRPRPGAVGDDASIDSEEARVRAFGRSRDDPQATNPRALRVLHKPLYVKPKAGANSAPRAKSREGGPPGQGVAAKRRSARRVTDGRSEEGPAGARLASRFARAGRSTATGGRSAAATPGARALSADPLCRLTRAGPVVRIVELLRKQEDRARARPLGWA